MHLLWLLIQLVFWLALMGLVVAAVAVAVLGPPYLGYRMIREWRHRGVHAD